MALTLIVSNAARVDAHISADRKATAAGCHEAEAAFFDCRVDFVCLHRIAVISHVSSGGERVSHFRKKIRFESHKLTSPFSRKHQNPIHSQSRQLENQMSTAL